MILLTAPPASGKTFLITQLIEDYPYKAIVISPLRALADECQARWGDKCVVMTPEQWLKDQPMYSLVIVDEFHLWFHWGDTFRPNLWECFYALAANAEVVLGLTATLTESMRTEIALFESHFDQILWLDHGNQQLKYRPARYLKIPSDQWLKQYIPLLFQANGTELIFCRYREEVKQWETFLKNAGFQVWSCVGGEAAMFSQKLKSHAPPEFIVATTVLSHGVNLPSISRIYFTHQVDNSDFWIQMVARGGRRGERFEVFSPETPYGIKWNAISNFLAIQHLEMRMKVKNFAQVMQAWFLKA